MRYLVTGGAGFIGSHLVDLLVARGDSVLVLDDLSTGRRDNLAGAFSSGVELVEGSVTDPELVDSCVRDVDRCFHLASAVGVRLIVSSPSSSITRNLGGTEIVSGAAAKHAKRLLFTSTSEVYGKHTNGPLREDADRSVGAPSVLRWSYADAKALGEALIHARAQEMGAEGVIARLFNVVGPRQSSAYGMVLPRFVGQALGGEPMTVYGDGTQTRCFVHVSDAVLGLAELMDSDKALGGTFNVGSQEEIAIADLAQRVKEASRSDSEIVHIPHHEVYGENFEEPGRRMPDLTAIGAAIGWRPRRSLEATIQDTIAERGMSASIVAGGALSPR